MAIDARLLNDKVVVVGGATGEVGGALVRELRAHGARVGVAVRRAWQVQKVGAAFGNDGILAGCVPTIDGEAAAGFVKGVRDALGPIDALLCANGAFRGTDVGQDAANELQDLLDANLLAGATLARAVVGPMRRRRTGSLVFVGSSGVGAAGPANYLASKAALHEWVRSLAVQLEGSGVRAAAVLPGTIDTEANRAAMPDADRSAWLPIAAVVQAILAAAFAPPGPGPLYPLIPAR
jgi:NAD(P)-dependent dehydrogenase (short-subunit alcohol dehydrogenase family)